MRPASITRAGDYKFLIGKHMNLIQPILFVIFASLVIPAEAEQVPNDTVVLRVGNFALTKAEYEKLIQGFDRISGATTSGASNQSVQTGRDAARLLALVSEAQRRKMDQDEKMQALIRVRGYTLMANALLLELGKDAKKDEAATRALWASGKNPYLQVETRQILIRYQGVKTDKPGPKGVNRTEAQAKAILSVLREKLSKGGDFSSLAKTSSDDEATAHLGGILPAFSRGVMTAEFETAAFNLPDGGVSEPIKTQFGYHIIQLIKKAPMPYESVKAALENIRARELYEQIGKSSVELNELYFKQ